MNASKAIEIWGMAVKRHITSNGPNNRELARRGTQWGEKKKNKTKTQQENHQSLRLIKTVGKRQHGEKINRVSAFGQHWEDG